MAGEPEKLQVDLAFAGAVSSAQVVWMVRDVPLSRVQATALAPLRARARDARGIVSVLRDRHAAELADRLSLRGAIPQDVPEPSSARRAVLRSLVIDGWVRDFAALHAGTVIELGAGFSTRCERLAESSLRWLELDMPPIIELRRRFLPPNAIREHVVGTAADLEWLDRVAAAPGPYCFIFEAVLAYVPSGQRTAMLSRIARRFPGATVILDVPQAWWHDRDPFLEIAGDSGLVLDAALSPPERCEVAQGAPYRIGRFISISPSSKP